MWATTFETLCCRSQSTSAAGGLRREALILVVAADHPRDVRRPASVLECRLDGADRLRIGAAPDDPVQPDDVRIR
jgi:hypothetical protein